MYKLFRLIATVFVSILFFYVLFFGFGANAQTPGHESDDNLVISYKNFDEFEGLEALAAIDTLLRQNKAVVQLKDGSIMELSEYRNVIVELNSPHILRNWNNDAPKYSSEYKEEWLCINGRDTLGVNVYYAMPGHIIADYGRWGELFNTKSELKLALCYIAEHGLGEYKKHRKTRNQ